MIGGDVRDSLSVLKACCASSSHMNLSTFFNSLKKGRPFSSSLLMRHSHHAGELRRPSYKMA
jgi:hypothetical protein